MRQTRRRGFWNFKNKWECKCIKITHGKLSSCYNYDHQDAPTPLKRLLLSELKSTLRNSFSPLKRWKCSEWRCSQNEDAVENIFGHYVVEFQPSQLVFYRNCRNQKKYTLIRNENYFTPDLINSYWALWFSKPSMDPPKSQWCIVLIG